MTNIEGLEVTNEQAAMVEHQLMVTPSTLIRTDTQERPQMVTRIRIKATN